MADQSPNEIAITEEDTWVQMGKAAYEQSTSFMDNNYRSQWEDNLRHFHSKHHSGSKYNSELYKYRSKVFRPKTRAAVRNNEAAAVAAFFANMDAASIEPMDPDDPIQQASAEINKALFNYHVENNIPWFQIVVGAIQDAQVMGLIASYQNWDQDFRTVTEEVTAIGEDGLELEPSQSTRAELKKDCPTVQLLPIENCRFHPNAQWYDVVNTSPYFIILWPMYVKDIKAKMKQNKWREYDDGVLMACRDQKYDSTRQEREDNQEDKTDQNESGELSEFDVVWVHEVFIDINGQDNVFFMLGTEYMLSQQVEPIENRYFTGERPVVIGTTVIEAHRTVPESLAGLGAPVQKELNENANQRLDNVKLVLNKRWEVQSGAQVDIKSLLRNVPGSITFVPEIGKHLKPIEFNDVTSSSYQEQDRLNVDFDELVGMFSPSTIQTNRRMNETVGGMSMLRGSSNSLTEYVLRTFSETWMERVVKQIVKLIQKYETNERVLAIAARKAKLWQRYGINQVTDDLLNQDLTIKVNVGLSATDPILKMQNFSLAIKSIIEIAVAQAQIAAQGGRPPLKLDEVTKEIFGRLGYRDGDRFSNQEQDGQQDPQMVQLVAQLQQMQQVIQQLQAQLQDKTADRQVKLLDTKMRQEGEDRRTAAELEARMAEKMVDLANPVAGENPRATMQ